MEEKSLYIHIPYCARKCMYCDFPSYCGEESSMIDYASALSCEIENAGKLNRFKTVFIGGGTPTFLSLESWKIIRSAIEGLRLTKEVEFTIECNPGTIDLEKLLFFRDMGVNRLSIGLQAWQDKILKVLGRIHRLEDFINTYNYARTAGFNNINIDIMFGLPGQDLGLWEETLENVTGLNPEHISCYSLIVEEGTPFQELKEKEQLDLPDEEIEREMYNMALELLNKNGYKQYEISNFSKAGRECRHNLVYWKLGEYIGCGAAAHSYLKGERYRNEVNIEQYIRMLKEKGHAIVERHSNTTEDDMEEFMFMGLRTTEGVKESDFKGRFSEDIMSVYRNEIEKHEENGLLKRENGRVFLTKNGIEVSNMVMSDFILDRM